MRRYAALSHTWGGDEITFKNAVKEKKDNDAGAADAKSAAIEK
jgi:hypothetical protein